MGLDKLIKACALAVAIVFAAASARAETITLKLSHFVPPQHAFHKWVVKWTQKIEKESGGRLKFEIYPNGQLVGPPTGSSTPRATALPTSPSACTASRPTVIR
jgi:TRAP-type C4-dicarboxylate transport system substrate-binding protein